MIPNSINELIDCFKELPGIGTKSAERLVYSLLEFENKKIIELSNKIKELTNNIDKCEFCNCLIDKKIGCCFCHNLKRNTKKIIIVEKTKDIINFEKNNIYDGVYYVIEKLISPIDGIGPDVINLSKMVKYIEDNDVEEVILAIKPSIEGETTMNYIINGIKKLDINISKIAIGIPIGSEIECLDPITLELAFRDRKNIIK